MGWRTLAVDLDPQGNLGRDLGCRREGSSNHGRALLEAFRGRRPVTPLTGVRDGLDVVPTGARPSSTSGHSSPVSARATTSWPAPTQGPAAGRTDREVVDLAEDPLEVDRLQIALDDLLAESPSPNGR